MQMTGPRTSFGKPSRSSKGQLASSSSSGITINPWPRKEGKHFALPDSSLPQNSDDAWDQTDAYYYNNWLDIAIEPTRFLCGQTLKSLGLLYEVSSVLATAQLTDLVTQQDALYPDLVRQCLASAKLTYADSRQPVASQGVLSFFADGKRHEISIPDLCHVYGFDSTAERVNFPPRFPVAHRFWDFIASGDYFSRSAAQSAIRNPALRIGAKAISTIYFAKDDASKVRVDELIILYNAVRDTLSNEDGLSCNFDCNVNMGAVFAEVIADKRTKVAKGKAAAHAERMGSLLTRMFLHLGIDVSGYECSTEYESMDTAYLLSCEILAEPTTYRFTSHAGSVLFCRLPHPSLTDLEVAANIGFNPGTEYLCPAPARSTPKKEGSTSAARKSTSTSAPAPAPADEDLLNQEEEEDLAADTQRTQRSRAHIRRPYTSELTLDYISDNPDDAEYRRWMVASTKKHNGLLRRLLHMLQKGCSGSQAANTMPTTAPVQPPPAQPSSSARPTTRSSKRKKPLTDDDKESDATASD